MNETADSLAVIFPGQGSQEKDMGRDLAESSKEAMDYWKKAEKISNAPLREIYWGDDEKAMADTRCLQPALTVVNLNFWAKAAGKLSPSSLAGHSLGEYSALAAAGVLSPEAVLELVSLRGRLMAEADPDGRGAMAAVLKLALGDVEEMVEGIKRETGGEILIANYNSPAQFVLSGRAEAVKAAARPVKEKKGRLVVLPVSGAFHSPLMREAASELAGQINKVDFRAPKIPVYFNVTAGTEGDPEKIREIMAGQMTSSVKWIQIIKAQWEGGVREWIELGPKSVLTRLLKANLDGMDQAWEGRSVNTLELVDSL